jgi:hypothetical protein
MVDIWSKAVGTCTATFFQGFLLGSRDRFDDHLLIILTHLIFWYQPFRFEETVDEEEVLRG